MIKGVTVSSVHRIGANSKSISRNTHNTSNARNKSMAGASVGFQVLFIARWDQRWLRCPHNLSIVKLNRVKKVICQKANQEKVIWFIVLAFLLHIQSTKRMVFVFIIHDRVREHRKWSFGPTKQLEGRREGGGTRNAIKKKNSALHLQELWWKSVSDNVPSLIMVVMITSCSSSIKRKCIGFLESTSRKIAVRN